MTAAQDAIRPPHQLDDVPGWFPVLDQTLFNWFLDRQESAGMRGDLLEIGVYMGKSAIFLGRHLRAGEGYTVCDLFEGDAPDDANRAESTKSYHALTRRVFEENYLSFHDELPRVLQGPSSLVPAEVEPRSTGTSARPTTRCCPAASSSWTTSARSTRPASPWPPGKPSSTGACTRSV